MTLLIIFASMFFLVLSGFIIHTLYITVKKILIIPIMCLVLIVCLHIFCIGGIVGEETTKKDFLNDKLIIIEKTIKMVDKK